MSSATGTATGPATDPATAAATASVTEPAVPSWPTIDDERSDDTTLVDVLDRVIARGVVLSGDVVLSVAGVDLVHVGLRLVLRGLDPRPVR